MGQIVQQFEQKKRSENIDEKLGERTARNKVIPFTIQDKPQAQMVSPPSKSLDNENYKGKLPRREGPTPDADYSRQEVMVEVHPKRNHGPPKEKVAETPTSKDDLAPPFVIITEWSNFRRLVFLASKTLILSWRLKKKKHFQSVVWEIHRQKLSLPLISSLEKLRYRR